MDQKSNQDDQHGRRKTPRMPVDDPAYQGSDDQEGRIIEQQESQPTRPPRTGDRGQVTGQPNPGTSPRR